jgi:YedE family putative selenium metabolism protein
MGVCVACFERDIAGALGLHSSAMVQYIRPEIIGFVLGSFIIALIMGEYRPKGGSSTVIRFFLGVFAMIGALVFLGCPWRALLRLSGGDGNAITGLVGLATGIGVGVLFMRNGYNLGRSSVAKKASGWVFPAMSAFLLAILITKLYINDAFPISLSDQGPGAMRAPLWLSLAAGLVIGALAQRSRFCTMGSIRDMILARDFHLASGVAALVIAALVMNIILGQFKWGFAAQPIAHSSHIWNFLGMVLAGLAFVLAGGCPGRQLIMAGEGDSDAGIFVTGMIVGAGLSHNFSLAAKPDRLIDGALIQGGTSMYGYGAVVLGILFCLVIGFIMRDRIGA